jgi:hypothetical protein
MRAASGLEPNVLVMSKKVFDQLCLAKQITDCFRYTNPFEVGTEEGKKAAVKGLAAPTFQDLSGRGEGALVPPGRSTWRALGCRVGFIERGIAAHGASQSHTVPSGDSS